MERGWWWLFLQRGAGNEAPANKKSLGEFQGFFVLDRGIEPLCQDWESCILTVRWIQHDVFCGTLRKLGDSNPRYVYTYGSLANCWFQPLTQTSLPVVQNIYRSIFSQMRCKGSDSFSYMQIFPPIIFKKIIFSYFGMDIWPFYWLLNPPPPLLGSN